jgi:hypothetical protein
MSRYFISALALAAALIPAASYAGDGDASTSIRIMGYVPVICRAELQGSPTELGSGAINLGHIDEFCNSPGAYRVVVDYAGAGDLGTLVVDGREVPLSETGHTVLISSSGPAQEVHQLSYEPGKDQITALHVSVESDAI